MNIAVCIKQTPDTTTRIKIADSGKSIVEDGISWIINPYDEYAIEEALQLTEKHGGEVTIISLGPAGIEKTIREALAMGAHKAIRLNAERIPSDPAVTARALVEVLKDGNYDLIFMGRQAVDDDQGQVPSMVSQAMNLPSVSMVVELNIEGAKGTVSILERHHAGQKEDHRSARGKFDRGEAGGQKIRVPSGKRSRKGF
jgi:electron transfer flavoprotein beta subunit